MSTKNKLIVPLVLFLLVLSFFSVSALDEELVVREREAPQSEEATVINEDVPIVEESVNERISDRVIDLVKHDADGVRESEELNSKVQSVDRITEKSVIKRFDVKKDFVVDELPKDVIPSHAICSSGRTEFVVADSFDCQEAFVSDKRVNLQTNRGKDHAIIEVSLDVRDIQKPLIVVVHEQEFNTQDMSIFYFDKEDKVWRGLCHNLKEGKNECYLGDRVKDDSLDIRLDMYSFEGHAKVAVSDVFVSDRNPILTLSDGDGEFKEESEERLHLFTDGDARLVDFISPPVSVVVPPPPIPVPLANPNSGFGGFSYPGFDATDTNSGFEEAPPAGSDESSVNVDAGTEVLPEQEGFLALTGQAITDLATKNTPGLLATLALLGLLGYKGYQMTSKNARRRRVLRRLQ